MENFMKNFVTRSKEFTSMKRSSETNEQSHNEHGEGSSRKQFRVEFNPSDVISDPGLRKPMREIDVSVIDEVLREYVLRGPCQPKNHTFPKTMFGDEFRTFQKSWFEQFNWLEYSISKDAAYCFPCYLFKDSGIGTAYTLDGVKTWKNALKLFRGHASNPKGVHRFAAEKLRNFSLQKQSTHCFETHGVEVEKAYRIRLAAALDVTRYLLNQGLAFHGHDEGCDSLNNGNFLELIDWYSKRNADVANVMYENAPRNCKLTSPKIQKQLSSACAGEVIDVIVNDIGDRVFSLLVDEARDASIKEQMGVVFRYVNKQGCILERFIGIVHVSNTCAATLLEALKQLFMDRKLSFSKLRGQGYDGASNMRGEFNGLKALILKENSSARYIHCFSHQLQLVVISVAYSTRSVGEFFGYLVKIVNLVGVSCVRKEMLVELEHTRLVEALESGKIVSGSGQNQEKSLTRPGDTRWGSHYITILRFESMWPSIIQVLDNICEHSHSDENGSTAKGLTDRMESYEFIFCMFLMKHLLGATNQLSIALQQRDQNILMVVHMMSVMKFELQKFRDTGFEKLLNEVNTFCVKHEITLDVMEAQRKIRHRSRRRGELFTNQDFYRVDIFLQTVDRMILEMNHRFSEASSEILTCIACLDPRESFSMFDVGKLIRLAELYPDDFSQVDCVELEQQLKTFLLHVRDDVGYSVINDIGSLAKHMVRSRSDVIFPLVYRLIELALVLPVATASVERVFSTMKNIKTDLSYKIGDEWLNDFMTVYLEKDIFCKIENEAIMQRYQRKTSHRYKLPPLVPSSTFRD